MEKQINSYQGLGVWGGITIKEQHEGGVGGNGRNSFYILIMAVVT